MLIFTKWIVAIYTINDVIKLDLEVKDPNKSHTSNLVITSLWILK